MKKSRLFVLMIPFITLLPGIVCKAQTGIITTVIGTGTAGFSGDGGLGIHAQINQTNAIYSSPIGLVYISDAYNDRVRELKDFAVIETIAGTGTAGYNSDSIAATSAELYQPGGAVADDTGNVYIGDYYNNRIRKINAGTGIITTIAGTGVAGYGGDSGPATDAQLNRPYNVTLDGLGNLYVADQQNHRIRKINLSTGIITTVAGNGTPGDIGDGGPAASAEIYYPNYVHSDAAGNLYITDNGNHKIRKVSTSGMINTIVGTGLGGYSGDGGLATSAQLYYPGGTNLDTAGNLYIADYGNNVIRKVSTAGIITTIAGTGAGGYNGDGGLATDAQLNGPIDVTTDHNGNIYIADCLNFRVRKITPAPVIVSLAVTDTSLCQDSCITFTSTSTGAIDSVRWSSAGESIASPTSDTTLICFPDSGTIAVHFYAYGPGGIDSSSRLVSVHNCSATSTTAATIHNITVQEFWLSQQNDGSIILNSSRSLANNLAITIYDTRGAKILDESWSAGTYAKQIDGRLLPPGLYVIRLSNGSVLKWLKQ